MKLLYNLALVLIFFSLISCSKDEKEVSLIKEVNQELEMISAYEEGMAYLENNDTFNASKKFLEAELLFPQSDWAPKSALMASYAYYLQDYYSEATFNLERFIKTYPEDKRISYAYYLLAMCYYEEIVDEKKDLRPLLIAKEKFEFVIDNYPNTDFGLDSQFKIDLITDILASKEMYLGRHYIKKEKWIPAINRFKNVIVNYETTIYAEEALHRLVEIHYRIGLVSESKKYANLLGYNYLSSEWYKKSYKVFNKNYKTKVFKKAKEKRKIIKRFKKLFE
jgi:outer membrane protein assembly factor BamD